MTGTEESSADETPKHGVAFILIAAVLLPVLYVLSSGPVLFVFVKTGFLQSTAGQHFLEVFYAPLEWAYHHSNLFQNFMDAYIKLFGIK